MKERDLWIVIGLLIVGIGFQLSTQRIDRLTTTNVCHTQAMIEWEASRGSIWPVTEEQAAWRRCAKGRR